MSSDGDVAAARHQPVPATRGRRGPRPQGESPAPDPSSCEQEPIHIPGAIQSHGALLAALAGGGLVTHASANLAVILGRPAGAVLGRPLDEAVGEAACRVLRGHGTAPGGRSHSLPGPDGGTLHLHAHRSGPRICVDIEPVRPEPWQRPPSTMAQSVMETFKQATTCAELCELAVRGLKALTGYDRVMAYRFGEDGHGEVIAEACAAQLEPYLGLRYPAGDIPPQARRLYLRQRVCAMADSGSEPVPLLVDPGLDDGTALDLTHSALRSISPIHREYMRNMKNAASLTVALAPGPDLWGMLVCHHATARVAGPELRAAVDIFGQVVSLLLGSLALAEVHAQRAARSATLRALIDRLAAPMPVAEALAAAEAELLQVVGAAGAVVRFSGTLRCLGRTPPPLAVERALAVLQVEPGSDMLALDDLGLRHPELAACRSEGSGALLLPLAHGADDAILWFRPELLLTVAWAGNPAEHVTADPVTGRLSPRASFAAWRETMRGRSAPWAQSDLALARDVRSAVQAELAQRAEAELCVARTELERSKQLVLACVEDALVSLTIADATRPDWPLIYVNRMFLQMTGYEVGEVIGRNGRFLQGPATDPKGVAELRRAVSAGEKAEVQVINYRKDGTRFLNRLLLEPIHDDAGRLAAYRGRQFDVTLEAKQKAAEGQRQKMEALGRLSGGVAHEINNMLQPVTLLGQDVIDRGLVNDEGRQHLEIVLECAKNARRIIGDLLTFSRPTPRRAELHDPIVLLDDSLRLVRPAIPHGVALKVCIVGRPPAVTIDSTWFVQILLNLVTNAAAAMGGRGEVTIELEDVHGTGKSAGRERAGFVRLRVIDTGCGMDRTTLDRAFEPFFTTKAVGEGTGLGLPLVYGLVQEMGGSIELESEPGRGTTVTMWIPAPDGERNDGIDIGH